eukprot:SAG31_NODE_4235_length_3432_cov_1.728773_2_plen_95_part_00
MRRREEDVVVYIWVNVVVITRCENQSEFRSLRTHYKLAEHPTEASSGFQLDAFFDFSSRSSFQTHCNAEPLHAVDKQAVVKSNSNKLHTNVALS